MLLHELDNAGNYLGDFDPDLGIPKYWTLEPMPQPIDRPVFRGSRDDFTGEWVGTWEDLGPVVVEEISPEQAAIELMALDLKSIRAIRAILAGSKDPADANELEALETKSRALRAKIKKKP